MEKYNFNVSLIKTRLKELRISKKLTQKQLAQKIYKIDNLGIGRTAVTNWENTNSKGKTGQTLPDLQTLMDICNVLECDLDYLVGGSEIESQDYQTMSDVLHISEESISALINNSDYGQFLDKIINYNIINNKVFEEVLNRTHQLALNKILNDVITTSFSPDFQKKIKDLFNKYYFSVFPFDMSQENFCKYIKSSIPYSEEFNSLKFIEDNFLEDGKMFIYNSNDEFLSLCKLQQYEIIISSIADISYDYFISQNVVELSKQKLDIMLSDLLQDAINKEADDIKARIKKNSTLFDKD